MTKFFNISRAAGGQWPAVFDMLRRVLVRPLAASVRVWLIIACVAIGAASANAQDEPKVMDYQVKAADLINFPKYVDWPEKAFASSNSPITIAVFGDNNVTEAFQTMLGGGTEIGGHPLLLKRINSEADITTNCQILYIAASERSRVPAILEKLGGSSVLTVGESDNFLEQGGMINFVPQNRRIRLQVNLTAASQAHLRISSRLLKVADLVKGKQS